MHILNQINVYFFLFVKLLFNKRGLSVKEKVSFFPHLINFILFNKVIIKIMISMFKFGGRLPSVDRGLVGS